MQLIATGSPAAAGQPVSLTATANENVTSTGFAIDIVDQTTSTVVASCGTGSTCSASVRNPAGSHTYQAVIGTAAGGNVQASSNPVTVTWVPPSVTLTAGTTLVRRGQAVTLTATANENVASTGFAIDIVDQTTSTVVASCSSGSVCTTTVSFNSVTTQTYRAVIGTPAGTNVQASSPSVTVRWI